nr:PREDICTED: glycosylphosphatidylinositol anchor attachment 1 protein [Bemisia tabaci]XP_018917595.1 PREDICTED: glycosylphosphatidylinositol anchor attachment 1 protein [Bemisia tabaci]
MGLLTDPTTGQGKIIQILLNHHGKICVLLFLSSLVWFVLLAHNQFNAATYFSENALLPGLVKGDYSDDGVAKRVMEELEVEADAHQNSIPQSWIVAKFRQFGLDTYLHNFTLNYPLGKRQKYTGTNIYGILRAARGASTEAVVLSLPYRPPSSTNPTTLPGLALMLGLINFFGKQKYWAKDIIFLVTEHEQLGVQAWLEAYHGISCGLGGAVDYGDIDGRGGPIQAAINLEIHGRRLSRIDVKISGLNGQLPNLDLFNLVHRMCAKEGIKHTFYNKDSSSHPNDFVGEWRSKLNTLVSMVATQASGVPNGNHGLFHRFGIEALTLEGYEHGNRVKYITFHQLGRVVEGIFRSLNNLLERFHQSYFFYLLPASDRYVSIGNYMISLGVSVAALFAKSYVTWLQIQINGKRDTSKPKDEASIKTVKMVSADDPKTLNLVGVGSVILMTHFLGMNLLYICQKFTSLGYLSTEDSLLVVLACFSIISLVFPLVIKRCFRISNNWILLNILALNELATLLLCVAMHNFSLAFIASTIYVLPAILIDSKKNSFYKKTLWLLLHPLLLLFWAVLFYTGFTFMDLSYLTILKRAVSATKTTLVLSVVDTFVYGSWPFTVATSTLLPNWLMFWWVLIFSESRDCIDQASKVTKEKSKNKARTSDSKKDQ